LKRIIIYILFFAFFVGSNVTVDAISSSEYDDGYVKIGETVIPFPEYMPGTFFTKNGQACTCHDVSSIDCIASGPNCNCVRIVNIGGTEVDLLSVQCIGFARYCFYRLFGFTDTYQNTSLFYNAGTLYYGQVNSNSVKDLISSVKPGAHIRFKLANSEHSVILLSQNNDGFTVYQCNSGGNGILTESCIVSTKTYTWESFAAYAYRGITFANMPNKYPENLEYSDTPFDSGAYTVGEYLLTANLRLRGGAGTEYEHLDTLPEGAVVKITEVMGDWGKTNFNGKDGWISLKFAQYIGLGMVISPKKDSGIYVQNGYIYSVKHGLNAKEFLASFHNIGLVTDCKDEDIVGTGNRVSIIKDGEVVLTSTVVIVGDVNGDGWLTTVDLTATKAHLSGNSLLSDVYSLAADINGNGLISTTDYKSALYIIAKSK